MVQGTRGNGEAAENPARGVWAGEWNFDGTCLGIDLPVSSWYFGLQSLTCASGYIDDLDNGFSVALNRHLLSEELPGVAEVGRRRVSSVISRLAGHEK